MKSAIFSLLVLPAFSFAGDTYVCATDAVTGMRFDEANNSWAAAIFKARGKYIVTKSKSAEEQGYNSPFAWSVKTIGQEYPTYTCERDFNELGMIFCKGLGEFKFNQRNGRFLATYTVGYFNDIPGKGDEKFKTREGDNTPGIEIGKCSPIN